MSYSFLTGLALAAALFAATPAPAAAQTSDSLRLTADVGVVSTTGNTDLTTVNVGEDIRWRRGRLALGQTFSVVYGRSEGETTSSLWQGGVRADYDLSDRISTYGSVAFDRDRFAGIARRLEEGAGLTAALIRRARDRFEAEAGLSLVQQRSTQGLDDSFVSARGGATYVHHFNETTFVRQTVGATVNLENATDFRITSESSVVAPLSRALALKISYVVRFDNLPEPGFRTTDRLLTSGLQVTL